ncbi:DUF3131 domain-containing protein [Solirhodobacter olei]|uniref:DUF3131 domain-containing protein n=1 Tax=Solirhodobacter olei TaxID=2493082 RepID=UPI000FD7D73F|nr:DUF3131 domain-containing protein [Solirhodobacter olei]
MPVTRRALLRSLTALVLAAPGWRAWAGEGGAQPVFLILDGVAGDVPPEVMRPLLAALERARLPAGFLLRPGGEGARPGIRPGGAGDPTMRLVRDYLLAAPELGEPIAWAPGLAEARPYFQLRAAESARAEAARLLPPGPEPGAAALAPVTLATAGQGQPMDLSGIRAMGFRNLAFLDATGAPGASDRCGAAMPCLRGSLSWQPGVPLAGPLARYGVSGPVQLILPLDRLAALGPAAREAEIARVIGDIADGIGAGRLSAALPRDNVLWFAADTARFVGLLVVPPADPARRAEFAAFTAALNRAGIVYSLVEPGSRAGPADCVDLRPGGPPLAPGGPAPCVFLRAGAAPAGPLAAAGVVAVLDPSGPATPRLDPEGILHLPAPPVALALAGREAGQDPAAGLRDLVLTAAPEAYADGHDRDRILQGLAGLKARGPTEFRPLPAYLRGLLPADPVEALMRTTRRDALADPPAPPDDSPARQAALREDARVAFAYFTRMSERSTGLYASAVFDGPQSRSLQRMLTMWDFANLIQGVLAAHELGLMSDDDYRARARAILGNLPAGRIAGLTLPNSEIDTSRRAARAWDYNPFDTGHLLSALHELNRHPLSRGLAEPHVEKWQISRTVVGGRIQWVSNGRLAPAPASQYSHYTARAFALWGIAANSPYDTPATLPETDRQMALLYTVADIGSLGTEPMLVEGVEMGLSPPSAYLSDVLFFAQKRAYAESGELYCVSEGPIDRAPWFVYEGLRVDRPDDPWMVEPISRAPEYDSAAFRASMRLVSPKAAFLWAAMRPGSYSDLLLAYVRARARLEKGGYASGIYAKTGKPTAFYTDINTNGVILQAIAYILRGRRPRPV